MRYLKLSSSLLFSNLIGNRKLKIMKTIKLSLLLLIITGNAISQTMMFDDFNYTDNNDPAIKAFNNWSIVDGLNGPPSGAIYDRDNVWFAPDPLNGSNSLLHLQTMVNGATHATTQARIETNGYDYFEGTYAARVKFSNLPNAYGDANIQTFYTIVSYLLAGDGTKYSELDFEYMASDKWATSPNNEVMYLTAWNRYIADPWAAWKGYITDVKEYSGWHTLVMSATDGTNIKFWMDGVYYGSLSITDNDATSVYPRSNMQVAFANWVWNYNIGSSTDIRKAVMDIDWVLHVKDEEKTTTEVNSIVNNYRGNNIDRVNLGGSQHVNSVTNSIKTEQGNQLHLISSPNKLGFFTLSQQVEKLSVVNSLGQNVLQLSQTSNINLSAFPEGLYFINTSGKTFKVLR